MPGYRNMLLQAETKKIQSKLSAYVRSGELSLTHEVNQKHVRHYRRLVYNIIDDMLQNGFPIFFKYAAEKEIWDGIVHEFWSTHSCQTPQVWKVPGEFYEYACAKNLKDKYKIPFLDDLLLFEWIELDIHTMEDEVYPQVKEEGDILNDVIALNPEYRILSLQYPIHTTDPTIIDESKKGQYFVLIYREKENGAVQFMDISVLYALTIEKIEEEKNLSQVVDELQNIFNFPDKKIAETHIINFLNDLKERKFVTGFKK